jgi:hypothetical protein
VTLWALHTHVVDRFESTPRLAVISPEKGSGKTRTLEMLALLCPAPEHAFNMSAPVLFRLIASQPVTLLVDEADTYFGPKAKDEEGLRGLLNAGHRRGATALRCVGAGHEVGRFPVFCAVAMAGIGDLPDTLMDRSVVIPMKRRAPHERVRPYRAKTTEPEGHELRDRLAEWALVHADDLDDVEPDMPEGITDRPADVWEPLLAIAEVIGGDWPDRARAAAVEINGLRMERDPSLSIQLLADLRDVFTLKGTDRLFTEQIIEDLCAIEGAPWSDLYGKPLDPNSLRRRVKKYLPPGDLSKSTKLRIGDEVRNGYTSEHFADAWTRYLPSPLRNPEHPEQQEQPEQEAFDAESFEVALMPAEVGPCVTCGMSTRRYGARGNPRCEPCAVLAATRMPSRRGCTQPPSARPRRDRHEPRAQRPAMETNPRAGPQA